MDHAPAAPCCTTLAEKRRRAEPYVFYAAVLLAVIAAIWLMTREAYSDVGPKSAQPLGAEAR